VEQAFMPAVKGQQKGALAPEVKNTKEFYEVASPSYPNEATVNSNNQPPITNYQLPTTAPSTLLPGS
jgi:hypothetical protein